MAEIFDLTADSSFSSRGNIPLFRLDDLQHLDRIIAINSEEMLAIRRKTSVKTVRSHHQNFCDCCDAPVDLFNSEGSGMPICYKCRAEYESKCDCCGAELTLFNSEGPNNTTLCYQCAEDLYKSSKTKRRVEEFGENTRSVWELG